MTLHLTDAQASKMQRHAPAGQSLERNDPLRFNIYHRLIKHLQRAFFGPVTNPVVADAADLRPRELVIALVAATIILVVGFYPSLVLDVIKPAGEAWVARIK
jgi:hypothetical protein